MGEPFHGDEMQEFVNGKKVLYCNGYRMVFVPNKTYKSGYQGYVYEHRLVMERSLGRELTDDEVVHHKDGNRSNNDIANLVLMSKSEHARGHKFVNGNATLVRCKRCGKETKVRRSCVRSSLCRECLLKEKRSKWLSKEKLIELLKESNCTEIGKQIGVSGRTIKAWATSYGIDAINLIKQHGVYSNSVKQQIREKRDKGHGTQSKYRKGCRCDLCVSMNRQRRKDYYERNRSQILLKRKEKRSSRK